MTPTPFEAALGDAQDQVVGYAGTALPIVAFVAAAWLGVKYAKRIIRGL
jgi:hypothetical protein